MPRTDVRNAVALKRLTPVLPILVALVACALTGCSVASSDFWDRAPRVAGVKGPQLDGAPSQRYEDPLLPAPQRSPVETPPPAARARRAPARFAPEARGGPLQPTAEEITVLERVNQIRSKRGLRLLRFEPRLFAAARDHSREQLRHGYMGHGSPDKTRDELSERLELAGYEGMAFGEVVAWGYPDTRSVVEGWMNSRPHREILLDRTMTEAGFSRAGGYWTGNLGASLVPRGRMSSQRSAQPQSRARPAPKSVPAPRVRRVAAPRPEPAPLPKARPAPANPFELPIPEAKPEKKKVFTGG